MLHVVEFDTIESWLNLEAIFPQTLIDLVHPRLALLNKADMKARRIFHFGLFRNLHVCQRDHRAAVIG